MTDEEKEAIEYMKKCLDRKYWYENSSEVKDKKYHKIIVNLIEKQKKVIDTMAKELKHISYYDFDMSQEEVKQYFYRKVKNNE